MELVCWKIVGLVMLKSGNHFFFNTIVCQPYYLEYFLPPLERNLDHFQVLKIVSLDNCLKRQLGISCPSRGPFQGDAISGPFHNFHVWPWEAQRFVQIPVGGGGLALTAAFSACSPARGVRYQSFWPLEFHGDMATSFRVFSKANFLSLGEMSSEEALVPPSKAALSTALPPKAHLLSRMLMVGDDKGWKSISCSCLDQTGYLESVLGTRSKLRPQENLHLTSCFTLAILFLNPRVPFISYFQFFALY